MTGDPHAHTVLRRIALNHSLRRSVYLSLYAHAAIMGALGVVVLAFHPAWAAYLLCFAVVLGATGSAVHVRHRSNPVPQYAKLHTGRTPSTAQRGWYVVVFTGAAYSAAAIYVAISTGAEGFFSAIIGLVVILAVTAAFAVIPGWHFEHSSALYRRHIESRPHIRRKLETIADDRTPGALPFGPL
jgi:hypothetical protein